MIIYEEDIGKLIKLLQETGAGGAIKSITITAKEETEHYLYDENDEEDEFELVQSSVDFEHLLKLCGGLKELHLHNTNLTQINLADGGVKALVENGVELSHLTITNSISTVACATFFPLFGLNYPSHIILQDLPTDSILPVSRFLSVEVKDYEGTHLPTLVRFLAPSIGYIKHLSFDYFKLRTDRIGSDVDKQIILDRFRAVGTSLTSFIISSVYEGWSGYRVTHLGLAFLQKIEELKYTCSPFNERIFEALSTLSTLKSLSMVCWDATDPSQAWWYEESTSPDDLRWRLLEFIREPPPSLRIFNLGPMDDGDDSYAHCKDIIGRIVELKEAAIVGNVEFKAEKVFERVETIERKLREAEVLRGSRRS